MNQLSRPRHVAVLASIVVVLALAVALPASSPSAQAAPAFALSYAHTLGSTNVPW